MNTWIILGLPGGMLMATLWYVANSIFKLVKQQGKLDSEFSTIKDSSTEMLCTLKEMNDKINEITLALGDTGSVGEHQEPLIS